MEKRRSSRHRQPSLNYAQPEEPVQPVDVTVLTERSLGNPSGSPPEAFERARKFNENTLRDLTPHVQAYRSRWPDDLVIIIAEVSKPTRSWRAARGSDMGTMHKGLKRQLYALTGYRFPEHIINSVVNKRLRQPYVPGEGGGVRGNVAWVLKYRGGNGVFPNQPGPRTDEAVDLLTETTWIGAWVGCREAVLDEEPDKGLRPDGRLQPPMAVIIFPRERRRTSSDHHYYATSMIEQYMVPSTKYWWKQVREQPLFLFMHLHHLFNNVKTNVATADWEVNQRMVSSDEISVRGLSCSGSGAKLSRNPTRTIEDTE